MTDNSKPPGNPLRKRSILLHQCCAPCSVYPLERLLCDAWSVSGYFFNPNIHPYTEFMKRLEYVEIHNKRAGIEYFEDGAYNLRGFIKTALAAENENLSRCHACYRLRLNAAAKFAAQNGFSVFTTTLLYSRRQDHSAVKSIGEESAALNGIDFYYEDFRAGWQEGIERSKELNIYRQNYCGCIFSEEERYAAKIAGAVKPSALHATQNYKAGKLI